MRPALWHRVLFSAWTRPVLLILILLVVWDLAIRLFGIKPYLIPAPEAVVRQLIVEWPRLWRESLVTTYATLGGFALSIIAFLGEIIGAPARGRRNGLSRRDGTASLDHGHQLHALGDRERRGPLVPFRA